MFADCGGVVGGATRHTEAMQLVRSRSRAGITKSPVRRLLVGPSPRRARLAPGEWSVGNPVRPAGVAGLSISQALWPRYVGEGMSGISF